MPLIAVKAGQIRLLHPLICFELAAQLALTAFVRFWQRAFLWQELWSDFYFLCRCKGDEYCQGPRKPNQREVRSFVDEPLPSMNV